MKKKYVFAKMMMMMVLIDDDDDDDDHHCLVDTLFVDCPVRIHDDLIVS